MSNTELVFTRPLLLLLLIPALAITVIPYFFLPKNKRKSGKRIAALLLRSVILLLICSVLAGINLVTTSTEQAVAILVDLSDSTRNLQDEMINEANLLRRSISQNAQVCVLAFAQDSVCSVDFSENKEFEFTKITSDASDIGSAIEYATSLLPKNKGKRIILLSDGRQTDGDALKSARYVSGQGVRIDAIYYDPSETLTKEVQLTALNAPSGAYAGEEITLSAEIDSASKTTATLMLYCNGEYLKTIDCALEKGTNIINTGVVPQESGEYIYSLRLKCKEDTLDINNSGAVSINVKGKPKVLVITDSVYEYAEFKYLLKDDCTVTLSTPRNAPKSISELCAYDETVLVNINAQDMPAGYDLLLSEYVSKYGRTLLTVGGSNTYAFGNMKGTGYENLLPVDMEYNKTESKKNVALMLVIDCSRSMSANKLNLVLAKEGAIMCAETLSDNDYVGVVSFCKEAVLESELVQATKENKENISRIISSIKTGAGTAYSLPLTLAKEQLEKSDAAIKHVIFLSDGEPFDEGYEDVASAMHEEDITVSTIGLAYITPALDDIARLGGGKYYYAPSADELPDIMLGDTKLVTVGAMVIKKTNPTILRTHPLTEGFSNETLPSLSGYVGTTPKKDADVFLAAENGDPIFAERKLGKGTVYSFMSDIAGEWSGEWYTTPAGEELTKRLVTSTLSKIPISSSLNIIFGNVGNTTSITVETSGEEQQGEVILTVNANQKTKNIVLQNIAKGIYQGNIDTQTVGTYEILAQLTDGTENVDFLQTHLIVEYKQEYNLFNEEAKKLMTDICASGGGALFDNGDDHTALISVLPITAEFSTELLVPLGILISLLLLIDIAIRKLTLKDLKRFFGNFRTKA